jgi:hypothetical protein
MLYIDCDDNCTFGDNFWKSKDHIPPIDGNNMVINDNIGPLDLLSIFERDICFILSNLTTGISGWPTRQHPI